MPKCPFCGKEINSVRKLITEYHDYILSLDEKGHIHSEPVETLGNKDILYMCPECYDVLNFLHDERDVKDFLEERYIILRSDDPEIKRKGRYILYKGKIYKILEEKEIPGGEFSLLHLLYLELAEGELAADILKADLG